MSVEFDRTLFHTGSPLTTCFTALQREEGEEEDEEGKREHYRSLLNGLSTIALSFPTLCICFFCGNCDSISRCRDIGEEKAPTEIRGRRAVQGGERRIEKPSWFRNNNDKKLHKMKQNKNNKKKKQNNVQTSLI